METRSTRSDGCVVQMYYYSQHRHHWNSGGDGGELGGNGSNSSLSSPFESEKESCGGIGAVDT